MYYFESKENSKAIDILGVSCIIKLVLHIIIKTVKLIQAREDLKCL